MRRGHIPCGIRFMPPAHLLCTSQLPLSFVTVTAQEIFAPMIFEKNSRHEPRLWLLRICGVFRAMLCLSKQSSLAIISPLYFIEDCSHAHSAMINGRFVGTFGDAAAWSLQGQKIVSGGEGGIVSTKHQQWYHKMLLWGHYNNRCKEELPPENPLSAYALTGAGKKDRAHPLAVSIALTQLKQLGDFHHYKTVYAERMIQSFAGIPFFRMPHTNLSSSSAWYAMILHFDAQAALEGMNRDNFVAKLHQAGLQDINILKSTGLLHQEPLFTQPEKPLPHVKFGDKETVADTHFPQAQSFYDNAIKVPVFARKEDMEKTEHYISVINQVAEGWEPVCTATPNGEKSQGLIQEPRTMRLSKL